MALHRVFCKRSRRHADPTSESKSISTMDDSTKKDKKHQWKSWRKSKTLIRKMASKAPKRLRDVPSSPKRQSVLSISSDSNTSMIPHASSDVSIKDSSNTLNDILSPYFNMDNHDETMDSCKASKNQVQGSVKDFGGSPTRLNSMRFEREGDDMPKQELGMANFLTESMITPPPSAVKFTVEDPAQKMPDQNDPIQSEDADDSISFDNDMISHSTSRRNSASYQLEIGNSTEFASISDANVQVFRKHHDFKDQLRVVRQQPLLAHNRPSQSTSRRPFSEDYMPLSRSRSATPKLKFTETEKFRESSSRRHMINSTSGQFGVLSRDSSMEFNFTSNEQVFRQEISLLIEKHKSLVGKQQQKIIQLESLLNQEKKINAYLSTSPKFPTPKATTPTNPKRKRYRGRFLPMRITLPEEESVSTDNSKRLLPPFDTNNKLDSLLHPGGQSCITKSTLESVAESEVADAYSTNRASTTSTVYYSAYDSSFNDDAKEMCEESVISTIEPSGIKMTRSLSISSSVSSIMSGSHKMLISGIDNNASNNSTNSGSDPSNLSSGLSTYSIQSNLTTPETINMQSTILAKSSHNFGSPIDNSYITAS